MARSHDSLWLGTGATLIAVSAALLGVAASLDGGKGTIIWASGPAIGSYVTLFLAGVCLIAAARDWRFPLARGSFDKNRSSSSSTTSPDPDHVWANMLANMVRKRWNDEAKARHLEEPDVITVRWRGDDKLQGHTMYIDSAVSGRMDQIKSMVDQFLALTPHRLMLVGPPGSGKTALSILMMLEVLSRRKDQSAVPVMLSLSSWDLQCSLRVWAKRRIVSEYKPGAPGLRPGRHRGPGRVLRAGDAGRRCAVRGCPCRKLHPPWREQLFADLCGRVSRFLPVGSPAAG